jgi:alkylated DNA nucleotide flippase Atl1
MSSRAEQVAEVLWELKRAEKLGTYSLIAERAGFSAGSKGRTIITCLKKVRMDWPHLQWWRAIDDQCCVEKDSEQAQELEKNGFAMEAAASQDRLLAIASSQDHLICWETIDAETDVEEEVSA